MNQNLRRFVKRLTANRKQFGVMVMLAGVALLMWGRLLLKDIPRTAVADGPGSEQAQAAPPTTTVPKGQPTVIVDLTDQSSRDLFRINSKEFSKVDKPNVIPPPNPAPEKSDEARRAELSAKLKDVRLQSTIMSDRPAALINDRLYHEGSEPVHGFTITRITQHSVFLKRAEVTDEYELRMYRK